MSKRVCKIIDIHSHILPNVDDGSDSFDTSLAILKKQQLKGVEKVILTPHYKHGSYNTPINELQEKFRDFKNKVKEKGLNVELFLGQEIFCDDDIYDNLKNGVVSSINNTKYVLVEFNIFRSSPILEYVRNLTALGYVPIIAHVERYLYLDAESLIDLKQMGALIQANAESVIGHNGKKMQDYLLEGIAKGLIDFVASDIHTKRQTKLYKAYKIVEKYICEEAARAVFYENAERYLINNENGGL